MSHTAFVKDFVWLDFRDKQPVRVIADIPGGSLVERAMAWEEYRAGTSLVDVSHITDQLKRDVVGDYAVLSGLLNYGGEEREIVREWRERYDELLTPGPILRFLSGIVKDDTDYEGAAYEGLLRCERFWELLRKVVDAEEALYLWNASRLAWAAESVQRGEEARVSARIEFVMDYLVWQRAIALDVERLERMAGSGDMAAVIRAWDGLGVTLTEREDAMRVLLRGWSWPKGVMGSLERKWHDWVATREDYRVHSILGTGKIELL